MAVACENRITTVRRKDRKWHIELRDDDTAKRSPAIIIAVKRIYIRDTFISLSDVGQLSATWRNWERGTGANLQIDTCFEIVFLRYARMRRLLILCNPLSRMLLYSYDNERCRIPVVPYWPMQNAARSCAASLISGASMKLRAFKSYEYLGVALRHTQKFIRKKKTNVMRRKQCWIFFQYKQKNIATLLKTT